MCAECLHHPFRLGGPQRFRYWGTKTEVVHMWADWLHHRCRLGGPQSFTARNKVESGPHVGGLGTLPLPFGGPQRFKAGERIRSNTTPAVMGVPNTLDWGTEVADLWRDWLHQLCCLGGPQRFIPLHSHESREEGTKSKVAAEPMPSYGPTSGPNCYVTPVISGTPEEGTEETWVYHPYF